MTDMGTGGTDVAGASAARILVVDDEAPVRDILAHKLKTQGHLCDSCENGGRALRLLGEREFELLLADIERIGMSWSDFLMEAERLCPDIAVMLLASEGSLEVAVSALKGGAYDYIMKPFTLEEVTFSVRRALEKRRLLIDNRAYRRTLAQQVTSRTQQLREALDTLQHTYHSTLLALGTALDRREADNDGHSLRVTLYTLRVARELNVGPDDLLVFEQGALLHDIGKLGVPDVLLRKPSRLDDAEWGIMRRHPEMGYRILSGIKFLQRAAELVLQHHERYDGKGYPRGLRGEEITLGARIFALSDTFDSLTSERPFQAMRSLRDARNDLKSLAGSQLDPALIDTFLRIPIQELESIREEVASKLRRKPDNDGGS
jgi:putative nucleotidyltransferase with HDIG domain